MRDETRKGRERAVIAMVLALVATAVLSACVSGQGQECAGAGGCAAVISVPTSDVPPQDDGGGGPGADGVLRATRSGERICLYLDRGSKARVLNLVMPAGTRATPLGDRPARGEIQLRLLGGAGIGGIRTGDDVRIGLDRGAAAVAVPGCAGGAAVAVRWITRTTDVAPSATF